MNDIPESDWKYMRTLNAGLLETLCKRLNDEALRTITGDALSEHERFLRLFEQVMNNNEIIAKCFDDWRRSTLFLKLLCLRDERLLTDEHLSHLTEETQKRIEQL
jgi:hypothetical protein